MSKRFYDDPCDVISDELATVRQQRDELVFRLGQYFEAERAQDKKGQNLALGHILLALSEIENSSYPYQAEEVRSG